jgi:hypothetical protein
VSTGKKLGSSEPGDTLWLRVSSDGKYLFCVESDDTGTQTHLAVFYGPNGDQPVLTPVRRSPDSPMPASGA